MSKVTMTPALLGLLDFRNETPWEHAPIPFDEWKTGAPDTPEQVAYWAGYSGGIDEAMHRARQRLANG